MKRLKSLNRYSPVLLAMLRIVAALLFLSAGLVKLLGFPAGAQPGQMPIMSLLGLAAILEVVGGILLILGLFTRPVAFILSGEMAVAYWMFHAPKTSSRYSIRARQRSSSASSFCIWWQQDPVR
jgi:putative oxidoreductase